MPPNLSLKQHLRWGAFWGGGKNSEIWKRLISGSKTSAKLENFPPAKKKNLGQKSQIRAKKKKFLEAGGGFHRKIKGGMTIPKFLKFIKRKPPSKDYV